MSAYRILLLSDTHGWLHPGIEAHAAQVDEIWHAGDVGQPEVLDQLESMAPLRAVFGNIDGQNIRRRLPETLHFECKGLKVFMTHILGRPRAYPAAVRQMLQSDPPDLMICGHSHILLVEPILTGKALHLNPGACGKHGWHQVMTMLRLDISHQKVAALSVIELGLRGKAFD